MSLAMFAAPINDNSNITLPNNIDDSDNILNQKRHKRTQKKYPKIENFDTNKVNSVLQKIHDNLDKDEEDEDKDNFNPPPPPESAGVQKTIPKTENFVSLGESNQFTGKAPSPMYDEDNLYLNDYNNYGDSKTAEEYYKRILPDYKNQIHKVNSINRPYYNLNNLNNNLNNDMNESHSQDLLLKKLNYMISLLEDQKDEKTDNVTEEVILYSFLGIFIIFIADTFVRAGNKYVR
jgi:hypothetical protein